MAVHDGMPRAYLRIDPNLDQTMPDLEGFVRLLCAAARQPDRGRFKELSILERALGKARTRRFLNRGDIAGQPDGSIYVLGWDEWQEGDLTVAERMRRMRARRAAQRNGVTGRTSPPRNEVTTDAVGTKGSLVGSLGDGSGVDSPPSPRQRGANPRANGESPRQVERRLRLEAPQRLGAIVSGLAAKAAER